MAFGHEVFASPPCGDNAPEKCIPQLLANNPEYLAWMLSSGFGPPDPQDKLHFLELFAGSLAILILGPYNVMNERCQGKPSPLGVHMLKTAVAALGFITHAMDMDYSTKMDISTSFGFILALAAKPYLHSGFK